MFIFTNAFLIGTASGLRALIGLTAVSWAVNSGVLALDNTWLTFLGYAFTPYILSLMANRRAGQRQASEDSKPIGTSSVHHQNRYECSVRSCDWAFWPQNDHRAGSGNCRSCGRNIRRS
jgi:hypothetical protein